MNPAANVSRRLTKIVESTFSIVFAFTALYASLYFAVYLLALVFVAPGERGQVYALALAASAGMITAGYWVASRLLWQHCALGWIFGASTTLLVYLMVFVF